MEKEGPKRAYQHIQEALGKFQQGMPRIDLQDVAVTDESHPLISLMKIVIQTGGHQRYSFLKKRYQWSSN